MIARTKEEKKIAFNILESSFQDNPAVLDSVINDNKVEKRIRFLITYVVNLAYRNNGLYISSCKSGAAIAMRYDTLKMGLRGFLDQINIALFATGLKNVKTLLEKERKLKEIRNQNGNYYYGWFMAVDKENRGGKVFREMYNEIYSNAKAENLPFLYETSVERNVMLYKLIGAEVYQTVELSNGAIERCFRHLP